MIDLLHVDLFTHFRGNSVPHHGLKVREQDQNGQVVEFLQGIIGRHNQAIHIQVAKAIVSLEQVLPG